MADIVGKNTPSSDILRSYIERLERIDAEKKALTLDRAAVLAEAKSAGYSAKGIGHCIRVRKMKPHDRQEEETIRDLYLHAIGLDVEPPLFRQIAALSKDTASTSSLIEAWKTLVPAGGEVIVRSTGKPVRIWRDTDGTAHHEDYRPPEPPAPQENKRAKAPPPPKKDVPDCTADEAEELGRQAAKDNQPIIDNPFPFDDERRPRWDLGWRKETGSDGMGR